MEYLVKSFDGHETKVEKASTFEDAKAKMQRAYKAALASADDKDEAEAAVYEDGELRYWLPASGRPVNLSVLRLSAICDRELQRVGLAAPIPATIKVVSDEGVYLLTDGKGKFWTGPKYDTWESKSGATWMTADIHAAKAQAALLERHRDAGEPF